MGRRLTRDEEQALGVVDVTRTPPLTAAERQARYRQRLMEQHLRLVSRCRVLARQANGFERATGVRVAVFAQLTVPQMLAVLRQVEAGDQEAARAAEELAAGNRRKRRTAFPPPPVGPA